MLMFRPATNSLAIEREILNFLRSRGYVDTPQKAEEKRRNMKPSEQPRNLYRVAVQVEQVDQNGALSE